MTLLTLDTEVIGEFEEKKSDFLSYLLPHERFKARLAELRDQHPKANHHVTAFRHFNAEEQIVEGSSDDGEPKGTSGVLTLKTLIGANLIDVGVITVRYFGGTKLGTGGLARAYAGSANAAIAQAREQGAFKPWVRLVQKTLQASFEKSSLLEREIAGNGWRVLDRAFDDTGVVITVEIEELPE